MLKHKMLYFSSSKYYSCQIECIRVNINKILCKAKLRKSFTLRGKSKYKRESQRSS